MRGMGLLVAVLVGAGCSFDSGGNPASIDGGADAPDAGLPDAGPDAAVVECTRDEHCETPPSPCQLAGLCDPSSQRCEFPQKDCSDAGDSCNTGTCEAVTGNCVPTPEFDSEDCSGGTTCDAFGSCGDFDPGDVCDETGTRTRDCTDRRCSAGACLEVPRLDSEGCTRDQDGVECESTECGGFGSCMDFSDTCDEHGARTRDCTSYACASASCAGTDFTERKDCTRSGRDGITCAPDNCDPFTDCQFSPVNECDQEGLKTRVCTPFACESEVCVDGSPFSDDELCTRDTSTVVCDVVCDKGLPMCVDVTCVDGDCPTGAE